MTDPSTFPGNIEAAFVRLEGKIDLMVAEMKHSGEETIRIRDRVHHLADAVTPIVLLNVPAKLTDHHARLSSLEADREQRKGAMVVMRGLWAFIGFLGAGALFAVIKTLGEL